MTQAQALNLMKLGHNVFLTGAAGAGKTYVLNQYITYLREHGVGVAVTASTGIAATHLGGQTIHSWSGMGVSDALTESEFEKIAKRKKLKERFKSVKVLVIDEISMLHAHQLDLVDWIARQLLDFTKPFGGLQVILCGDFFQLPPISRGERARFAYEANAWATGEFLVCYLGEQHRQGDDPLLSILNDIRGGRAGEHTKVPLRTRYKKRPEGAIEPTRLYTHNADVDRINDTALEALAEKDSYTFEMTTRGLKHVVESLKAGCLAPAELRLKKGAVVMFVKNDPSGAYVNGTLGVVELFDPEDGWPIVRTREGELVYAEPVEWRLEVEGETRAMISQVPLRLAWAITVHKSQGMTLDAAEVDLAKSFEPGMGYVALSRVRALAGLMLMGLNDMALSVNDDVLLFDERLKELSAEAAEAVSGYSEHDLTRAQQEVLVKRFGGTKAKKKYEGYAKASWSKKGKDTKPKTPKVSTLEVTKKLIDERLTVEEMAKRRGVVPGTIVGHLEKLKALGELPDISYLRPSQKSLNEIKHAFDAEESNSLTPVFNALEGKYSFEELKLARLFLDR